jgi:hypothetical protein
MSAPSKRAREAVTLLLGRTKPCHSESSVTELVLRAAMRERLHSESHAAPMNVGARSLTSSVSCNFNGQFVAADTSLMHLVPSAPPGMAVLDA